MTTRRDKKRIPWRVRRRHRLLMDGFLPWELHRFRGVNKLKGLTDYPLSRPYVKRMRIARRQVFREAKDRRFTMAEYRREITRLYKVMGWVDKQGRPDIWVMFRYFYYRSIRLQDYTPPPKKKKKWSKGDVEEQRRRYKDKQEAKKRMGITRAMPTADEDVLVRWIEGLEAKLKTESNPQRQEQYRRQIKNLRGIL